MKKNTATLLKGKLSYKRIIAFLGCLALLVSSQLLVSCTPVVSEYTDIDKYNQYTGTYDNQFVKRYIRSFFPESIDDDSVEVLRYSYYAKKLDTYGFEAYLELKIHDTDTFNRYLSVVAENVEEKPFVYDESFMEYDIENVLILGNRGSGNYYSIEQAKIRKVLFQTESQTIIYVAMGVYDGGGTQTDELHVFFDRFGIDPNQYAQTADSSYVDPYSITVY